MLWLLNPKHPIRFALSSGHYTTPVSLALRPGASVSTACNVEAIYAPDPRSARLDTQEHRARIIGRTRQPAPRPGIHALATAPDTPPDAREHAPDCQDGLPAPMEGVNGSIAEDSSALSACHVRNGQTECPCAGTLGFRQGDQFVAEESNSLKDAGPKLTWTVVGGLVSLAVGVIVGITVNWFSDRQRQPGLEYDLVTSPQFTGETEKIAIVALTISNPANKEVEDVTSSLDLHNLKLNETKVVGVRTYSQLRTELF